MSRRLDFDETVAALTHGEVVAIPTDTVYGVAASVWSLIGVAGLFALKRRPRDVALPLLVASVDELAELDVVLDESARRLADALWPGALTMVVPAPLALARTLGASDASVGLRVPNDEVVLSLVRAVGPLAVTSANEHGGAPCTNAEEILRVFGARSGWAGVYDAGERRGAVSSVVDLRRSPWRILRHGAISEERIAEILA
ncbi:MAG: threonylcarbamoyl-AMP synthase [Acidobacteriota bacterium]|nr:threonylcarbamoyl-AMP synthase [Acidobacteriota bacterium]